MEPKDFTKQTGLVCFKCHKPPHYREWDTELICDRCNWFIPDIQSFSEAIQTGQQLGYLVQRKPTKKEINAKIKQILKV